MSPGASDLASVSLFDPYPALVRRSPIPTHTHFSPFPSLSCRSGAICGWDLSNAPIREAVLELRTSPPQQDIEPTLREIIEGLEGYKEPTTLRVFEGNISFSGGDEPAAETVLHRVQGFRASSEDDLRVIQFKVDGVTFSRLAPYTTWEEAAAEAKILWQAYADVIAPETVTRIAVRYINHIRLPHPIRDIDDYFTSLPRIPDTLPQVFTSFLSRVTIFEEERQFSAHVSHVSCRRL